MSTKGPRRGGSARRGRGKAAATRRSTRSVVAEEEKDDVPELEDATLPSINNVAPTANKIRLNSLSAEDAEVKKNGADENSEDNDDEDNTMGREDEDMEAYEKTTDTKTSEDDMKSEDIEAMTVIDEVHGDEEMEDTEMVSEDDLPSSENKEPLETEAVSDEELPDNKNADLPETEAVSEDELPVEDKKKKKKKQAQQPAEMENVSEDELTDEKGIKDEKKDDVIEDKSNEETEEKKSDGQKRKLNEGEYDPSSPTSENSQDGSPPAKKTATGDAKPTPKGKKSLPELEKYWKTVKDDPTDFTGWTYLLQYVDQENDIEAAREAYDAFLANYPYCYGYWRKYADYEKKKGNVEMCEKVFDRGLKAIPLSVDLWLHYLNYCKAQFVNEPEKLKEQFERAIKACGLEFRSDRLWESYIKWETEQKNLTNITALYDRLLATPTQGYTTHFDNFQEHVSSNPPQTILPVDDFLELRREVLQMLKQYDTPAAAAAAGEEAPPGEEASTEESKDKDEAVASSTRMDEETTALRERIISTRRKVHKATVSAVAARWNFEEGIKRPYFHVKPLERCQLKNWKEYLDYETEQGNEERIVVLYERCLIACALYEEFWQRYVKYLESLPEDMTEKIRDVYERACLIHHKKKPNLHLNWAIFEEVNGNYEKAGEVLENLDSNIPNLLQVAYRRINLERRHGSFEKVSSLYEHYLASNKNKLILTNMTIKYSRFTARFLHDMDKAIEILKKAIEKEKDNTRLYLQLVDLLLQREPVSEDEIVDIFDQFINKDGGELEHKLMFVQRKVEFLEDYGASIVSVQKAHDEYQKHLKQVRDKRKKDSESSHKESSSKKSKSDSSSGSQPPLPSSQPSSTNSTSSSYPATGYSQNYQYQQGQYPTGYNYSQYGQGPPSDAYNNYQNWQNYPQGGYQSGYGQPGWGGYYGGNY